MSHSFLGPHPFAIISRYHSSLPSRDEAYCFPPPGLQASLVTCSGQRNVTELTLVKASQGLVRDFPGSALALLEPSLCVKESRLAGCGERP